MVPLNKPTAVILHDALGLGGLYGPIVAVMLDTGTVLEAASNSWPHPLPPLRPAHHSQPPSLRILSTWLGVLESNAPGPHVQTTRRQLVATFLFLQWLAVWDGRLGPLIGSVNCAPNLNCSSWHPGRLWAHHGTNCQRDLIGVLLTPNSAWMSAAVALAEYQGTQQRSSLAWFRLTCEMEFWHVCPYISPVYPLCLASSTPLTP
ncbi:hypothetical protein BKA70DRAFT_464287 [Coprinopsis sp. MPI-PUGE-AT-0042]|nr:hypothetical protein BKA70DRAFT_464287 [Coprinopsis sp. MPI-PUGE-AT-0042]